MNGYSKQDVKAIENEIDNLNTSWQLYSHDQKNGRNVHLHYPPALFFSMVKLVESFGNEKLDPDNLDVECQTSPRNMANFAASVFEWAQLAARNGILAANMTPCNCTDITDEDIATLIGENNGSGENRSS